MLFGSKKPEPAFEERLQKVERGLRALEMDWESVLERLQARLAKLGRTRQRLEELQAEDAPSGALAEAPSPNARVLDPISERILQRRSRIISASRPEREQ